MFGAYVRFKWNSYIACIGSARIIGNTTILLDSHGFSTIQCEGDYQHSSQKEGTGIVELALPGVWKILTARWILLRTVDRFLQKWAAFLVVQKSNGDCKYFVLTSLKWKLNRNCMQLVNATIPIHDSVYCCSHWSGLTPFAPESSTDMRPIVILAESFRHIA